MVPRSPERLQAERLQAERLQAVRLEPMRRLEAASHELTGSRLARRSANAPGDRNLPRSS
jgi:hypothetical protein